MRLSASVWFCVCLREREKRGERETSDSFNIYDVYIQTERGIEGEEGERDRGQC
jgi:hypothetical protein